MIERSSIKDVGEPTNAVHAAWFFLDVASACPTRVIATVRYLQDRLVVLERKFAACAAEI
jgi:hypothetical protein